ncbi:hypothetical protein ASPWEDRAFT_34352 [Aspergillus wentii DTO 134E9]|uniref:Uncharacterized protein n=1 Tax=Aspergillus wentii DTO 134E9 TaxID=1073089 RepID=A0A1L9S159_ASPWE|nr:uncharacterized protein ASPWEDRAFT_34352 [Aspergillus wentii DTO 134E9]OJJ40882.1 hypothetical protein ASPWEDRAFT_34352 [Aspergillus wentii DTO 134E9]
MYGVCIGKMRRNGLDSMIWVNTAGKKNQMIELILADLQFTDLRRTPEKRTQQRRRLLILVHLMCFLFAIVVSLTSSQPKYARIKPPLISNRTLLRCLGRM